MLNALPGTKYLQNKCFQTVLKPLFKDISKRGEKVLPYKNLGNCTTVFTLSKVNWRSVGEDKVFPGG